MFKHIIVLALCFMAYIVGNFGGPASDQRITQFNKLTDCYGQMFQHGLIKGKDDGNATFEAILTSFYEYPTRNYNFERYGNNKIVLKLGQSPQAFRNEGVFNHLKQSFIDEFKDQDISNKVKALVAKYKENGHIENVHYENDLMAPFVNHYNANSNQEIYTSVSAYCLDYMTK